MLELVTNGTFVFCMIYCSWSRKYIQYIYYKTIKEKLLVTVYHLEIYTILVDKVNPVRLQYPYIMQSVEIAQDNAEHATPPAPTMRHGRLKHTSNELLSQLLPTAGYQDQGSYI